LGIILFSSCTSDQLPVFSDSEEEDQYTVDLYFTDAPIDNQNIKSCYITVSQIKVNGEILEGYERTTVDILKYNKGETLFIDQYTVNDHSVHSIELELDNKVNDQSDLPGCFIQTFDGDIYSLSDIKRSIELKAELTLQPSTVNDIIIDFDLRKCIFELKGTESPYQLVSNERLSTAIRVSDGNSSVIKGHINELVTASDRIVVYVYEKGSYNWLTESEDRLEHGMTFPNTVNSALCNEDGDFELHFLPAGAYELHIISYDLADDGNLVLRGPMDVYAVNNKSLLGLTLENQTNVDLQIHATGVLEL
jgi:hypothetical protein